MPKGGYRPGAGRPKKTERDEASGDIVSISGGKTPLEFMLSLMNDEGAEIEMRARMAVAAAPFMHAKMGEIGKKEQKNADAKKASGGKFAALPPPRLVVSNR